MTIFSNQNLTIVSAAGRACQVQVPGQNLNLSADQTRALANAVAFAIVTYSKGGSIPNVAGSIDLIYTESNIIVSPLAAPFATVGLIVAVQLPALTWYATLLTIDQALQMSHAVASYTVVG